MLLTILWKLMLISRKYKQIKLFKILIKYRPALIQKRKVNEYQAIFMFSLQYESPFTTKLKIDFMILNPKYLINVVKDRILVEFGENRNKHFFKSQLGAFYSRVTI